MKTNSSSFGSAREDYTPRLIAIMLLAFVLLCALTRARAQTTNQTAIAPSGVYSLVSVDGKTVPCTIDHEGTAMFVQSGTFTISTNGQITSVMTISVGDRKDRRIDTHATYTLRDTELTMKWRNAGTTKGRVAGQTFTMKNEGMTYVYRK